MTFNDFRIAYEPQSDAVRLNNFVIQFDALWEQMRKIQVRRLRANAPPEPREIDSCIS